jgi:hypothetical protein
MNRVAMALSLVPAALLVSVLSFGDAAQAKTAKESGTVMRTNAAGQQQAAPRTGNSFSGCVKGGQGLGYSVAAAQDYCAKKLGHR